MYVRVLIWKNVLKIGMLLFHESQFVCFCLITHWTLQIHCLFLKMDISAINGQLSCSFKKGVQKD